LFAQRRKEKELRTMPNNAVGEYGIQCAIKIMILINSNDYYVKSAKSHIKFYVDT
jgi:hypothetical protein